MRDVVITNNRLCGTSFPCVLEGSIKLPNLNVFALYLLKKIKPFVKVSNLQFDVSLPFKQQLWGEKQQLWYSIIVGKSVCLKCFFFSAQNKMSIPSLFSSDYCLINSAEKKKHFSPFYLDRQSVEKKIRLEQDETCTSRKWFSIIAHSQHSDQVSAVMWQFFCIFRELWLTENMHTRHPSVASSVHTSQPVQSATLTLLLQRLYFF